MNQTLQNHEKHDRVVLALTGEPGAGKSTACKWFHARGAALIDADEIVRTLWKGDALLHRTVQRWGSDILLPEGTIDKRKISLKIFGNEAEYQWLCSVIHPLVFREMEKQLPKTGIVIAEIPMLFECGVPDWVTEILFMAADFHVRAARNRFRGLDEEELLRREKFFMPKNVRTLQADHVIVNDGRVEKLEEQLMKVWTHLTHLL